MKAVITICFYLVVAATAIVILTTVPGGGEDISVAILTVAVSLLALAVSIRAIWTRIRRRERSGVAVSRREALASAAVLTGIGMFLITDSAIGPRTLLSLVVLGAGLICFALGGFALVHISRMNRQPEASSAGSNHSSSSAEEIGGG